MAFQQLYYTSCEHGVGGYAGFQFNAVSQGVGAKVMREVEQLTVYELPSWDSSAADAPVNLCYMPETARGGTGAITANVVYAGTDFSGRTGNYFAHALVTQDPGRDFGALLPIELWESPAWARTTADSTTIPTMRETPPRGSVDRPTVAAFLRTHDNSRAVLARLLSAVDKAIDGGRSVVLWSSTGADNARWIAAVSYLLEDSRTRELSFYTYTRRPAQCRAHVIGTMPGAITSSATLAEGFRVFDMASHSMPDVETHPLAELLAQAGVLRAAGLWRQAVSLGSGTERSFDQWYPVVCAAAMLLGFEPLPSGAIDAIVRWLPSAARRPVPLAATHIETVLTVLLDRDELSDDQLRPLLPAAEAARAIGQLQRLEAILLNRAIPVLERGQPPRGPTPVVTAEGSQLAVSACERLLGSAAAGTILTVLDWAQETRLNLDERLVERRARDVIGPQLPAIGTDRRIVRVGQAYPAFARGLAAYLTAAGPDTALRLLSGVAGELLDGSDLRNYPDLREMLLIAEVKSRRLPAAAALREVAELRSLSASPWQDDHLLISLWPRGLQTPDEAEELLKLLDGDVRRTPVLKLLDDALAPPSRIGGLLAWLHLCEQVLAHPVFAQLPRGTRDRLQPLHGLSETLVSAKELAERGDMEWYAGLHGRIEALPDGTRDALRQYLAFLMLGIPRPADQLASCSGPVFDAACAQARIRLDSVLPDHALAARLFLALHEFRGHLSRAQLLHDTVLAPTIPRWSRHDQGEVAGTLRRIGHRSLFEMLVRPGRRAPDLSGEFRQWCKENAQAGNSDTPVSGRSVVARISGWLRPRAE